MSKSTLQNSVDLICTGVRGLKDIKDMYQWMVIWYFSAWGERREIAGFFTRNIDLVSSIDHIVIIRE